MENRDELKFLLDIQTFADEGEDEIIDPDDFDEEEGEETEEEADENGPKEGETGAPKGDEGDKKAQSKKKNAEYAERRRQREEKQRQREEEIRKQAYEEGRKAGARETQKVNTFTDEPIQDDYDMEVFNLQKKIEEEGGDPIRDLPKRLAQKQREEANQKKAAKEKEENAKAQVQADVQEYFKAFGGKPEEAIDFFKNDAGFKKFRKGKSGSLAEIYRDYVEFKSSIGGGSGERPPKLPSSTGRGRVEKNYSTMSQKEREEQLRKEGLIN